MRVCRYPSPNFGPRRGFAVPEMIVLHYTGMDTAQAALERLCDPGPEVSAHYLIDEFGTVFQLVEEKHRAWHAGRSCWRGCRDVNSASIGIELANPGPLDNAPPFPTAQMDALEWLIVDIRDRYAIPASAILAHSDVAPGRKVDPGAKFDWGRIVPNPDVVEARADPGEFWGILTAIGYDPDVLASARLSAFRLRHHPNVLEGDVTAKDVAVAEAVLARQQNASGKAG